MATDLFSTDPEIAVITILVRHPELAFSARGLKSYMFSSLPLSLLYSEIERMVDSQLVPDVPLILASLEARKELDRFGGRSFIESLLQREYNHANFSEYVRLVVASFKARTLISNISGITTDTINSGNVDAVISGIRKSLDNLSTEAGIDDVTSIGDFAKDVYTEIVSRTESPGIRGISWGIKDIDRVTGGKSSGEFWIISGRPGSGKTALMCNSALEDAKLGNPVLIIEREMRKQELAERMISIMSGIPLTNIRLGILNQPQLDKVYESLKTLKDYPIYIDTSTASDPSFLKSVITKYKVVAGVKVVYVDYIQLLSTRDDNQTSELGRLSREMKLLCNEGICIVAFSQLNRGVESREDKRPMMSDLRQSGNLEEDADFVVGLYRDEYYNKETPHKGIMEFIIQKSRNGPVGTISLKFQADTNAISSAI